MFLQSLLQETLLRLDNYTLPAYSYKQVNFSAKPIYDTYQLLKKLINHKNIHLLVVAFLRSDIWLSQSAQEIAYRVTDVSHAVLSSERVIALHSVVLKALKDTKLKSIPEWRKTVFLASLVATEVDEKNDKLVSGAWFSSGGVFRTALIASANSASNDKSISADVHIGLLISLSWVVSELTNHQLTKLSSQLITCVFGALYQTDFILSKNLVQDEIDGQRGFKELGLHTRTISKILHTHVLSTECQSLLETLVAFTKRLQSSRSSDSSPISTTASNKIFLAVTTTLEALLSNSLRNGQLFENHAMLALDMLQGLQDVHPDPSVFTPWRFCFNLSLDTLDSKDRLEPYVLSLIRNSPASLNPLLTDPPTIKFSKMADFSTIVWILTVIEASTSSLKTSQSVHQLFDFCYARLYGLEPLPSKEFEQLLHSAILSLFSHNFWHLKRYSRPYLRNVLKTAAVSGMTQRQRSLIVTTLYRLSLPNDRIHNDHLSSSAGQSTASNSNDDDPVGLKAVLFTHLHSLDTTNTSSAEEWESLVSVAIELLPLTPILHLGHALNSIGLVIASSPNVETHTRLSKHLVEICSEQMDSEKSVICVDWLLRKANMSVKQDGRVSFLAKL